MRRCDGATVRRMGGTSINTSFGQNLLVFISSLAEVAGRASGCFFVIRPYHQEHVFLVWSRPFWQFFAIEILKQFNVEEPYIFEKLSACMFLFVIQSGWPFQQKVYLHKKNYFPNFVYQKLIWPKVLHCFHSQIHSHFPNIVPNREKIVIGISFSTTFAP